MKGKSSELTMRYRTKIYIGNDEDIIIRGEELSANFPSFINFCSIHGQSVSLALTHNQ